MLFNSYEFLLVFLPVTLVGFLWLGGRTQTGAAAWLGCASLCFYGYWDVRAVPLLLASIGFNFAAGLAIARAPHGTAAGRRLIAAVCANLAVLAYFKYADFLIGTANGLLGSDVAMLHVTLPLGISFFTFTQIAFLADTRRKLAREPNFVHYLLFVTWFPHLIAGPVLHHKDMMPQFARPQTYRLDLRSFATGATLFTIGLSKKVLLADNLAGPANAIFDAAAAGIEPTLVAAWTGALSYTLQLYFDFSGYSDMAVGLSLLFGVRLPVNFDSPYRATDIAEFWRRWHMTLSRFLRDYLYIPMGGNRLGEPRRYFNLLVTMVLGGLWHGASWTFVAWGALHGALLAATHLWSRIRRDTTAAAVSGARRASRTLLTFVAVMIGWVYFRSPDFDTAHSMLAGMAGLNGLSLPSAFGRYSTAVSTLLPGAVRYHGLFPDLQPGQVTASGALALIALGLFLVWGLPNSQRIVGLDREPSGWLRCGFGVAAGVVTGILLAASFMSLGRVTEFLYFQF